MVVRAVFFCNHEFSDRTMPVVGAIANHGGPDIVRWKTFRTNLKNKPKTDLRAFLMTNFTIPQKGQIKRYCLPIHYIKLPDSHQRIQQDE